jgi:hypothetical protein
MGRLPKGQRATPQRVDGQSLRDEAGRKQKEIRLTSAALYQQRTGHRNRLFHPFAKFFIDQVW